ncbi:MAG: hypothetical protein V3U55_06545 [Mycobacterium sp.]
MKAKKPARRTASGRKPPACGGRGSAIEAKRMVDSPPRRRKPTREQRPQRSVRQTSPNRRSTDGPARPKSATQAKARAKARKAKTPKVVRTPLRQRMLVRLAAIDLNPRTLVARVPFVVLIIAALGTGLGVTLWLSTDAAERSYQLGNAREVNQVLIQQKEALERDVLEAQAAPALAEAARELGMIPSRDTAHLVQDATGNWVVVGTPKPAEGVPPPPMNAPLADPVPAAPPAPRVIEPLEVPVRIPSGTDRFAVPGAAPGLVQAVPGVSGGPAALGVPGAPGGPAALGVPGAPAAPLRLTPGVDVPHTVAGQVPTPGPGPLGLPGAAGVGVGPTGGELAAPLGADPLHLLPEVAGRPGAPLGIEQVETVPSAPA